MGWDIDEIILVKVRGILKERYAGCCYSMLSSYSPVIISYRSHMTMEERHTIVGFFPPDVRVECQETEQRFNQTAVLHGSGFSALGIFIYPEKREQHLREKAQWDNMNPPAEEATQ